MDRGQDNSVMFVKLFKVYFTKNGFNWREW